MTDPTSTSYLSSRQVGDAAVTIISDASGLSTIIRDLDGVPEADWRREVAADAEGLVTLGYNVAHVRIGAASILVDLGFDDPSPTSQWKAPRHQRTPGVPAGLAAIGVRPEDVTHVLITHSHGDHVAGGSVERDGRRVPRYPNARHYVNRRDWEGLSDRARPDSLAAIHLGTIERFGLLDLVDGDAEIVPGVTLVHAPGETPGHSLARVRSRGETFYFLGDLFHHPCEVAHLDWVAKGRNAAAMQTSRERLVADALASDAVLVATHIPFPPFGQIERSAEGVRWRQLNGT